MKNNDRQARKGVIFLYLIVAFILLIIFGGYFLIDTYYPLRYKDEILFFANKYDIDPSFVYSIIATESKGNVNSVSSKGAEGLMQIMPDTGDWAASKIGIKDYSEEKLTDPETNIEIGSWYLHFLMDRYGDMDTAAAAYNAGHGKVDEWLNNNDYSKDGDTLSYIPYKETRDYVKKVKFAYEIYKKIYKID